MNVLENYLKDLAANLRSNGHDEAAVEDTLSEILADPSLDRTAPQAALGTPKALADSYSKGNRRSAGFKVITAAASVALLIIAAKVVTSLLLNLQTPPWVTIATYAAAAALFVIGLAIGGALDRRLPSGVCDQLKR